MSLFEIVATIFMVVFMVGFCWLWCYVVEENDQRQKDLRWKVESLTSYIDNLDGALRKQQNKKYTPTILRT